MKSIPTLNFSDIATIYCCHQDQIPERLRVTLEEQRQKFSPDGWMLLQCVDMCSSYLGSYTLLPYGPNNSYKSVPEHPISPRGLASDMSTVVAILKVEDFINPGESIVKELRVGDCNLVEAHIHNVSDNDRRRAMEAWCQSEADRIHRKVVLHLTDGVMMEFYDRTKK